MCFPHHKGSTTTLILVVIKCSVWLVGLFVLVTVGETLHILWVLMLQVMNALREALNRSVLNSTVTLIEEDQPSEQGQVAFVS